MAVVESQVFADRSDKSAHAAERAAADALAGDLGEPALHEIEPRSASRCEVKMVARMIGEPLLNFGMRVGAVVVEDQVDLFPRRRLEFDLIKEGEELPVSMTRKAVADERALEDVECRQQRGGSVAHVVVSLARWNSGTERQHRLGAIQCLDLTLLVDAQHQRLVGRVEIETDDVADFGSKLGVAAQLETLDSMRLEAMRLPDAMHDRRTHAVGLRHRAHAPVRGTAWLRVQRGIDDRVDLAGVDHRTTTGTRGVFEYPGDASLAIPFTPQQNGGPTDAQLGG